MSSPRLERVGKLILPLDGGESVLERYVELKILPWLFLENPSVTAPYTHLYYNIHQLDTISFFHVHYSDIFLDVSI